MVNNAYIAKETAMLQTIKDYVDNIDYNSTGNGFKGSFDYVIDTETPTNLNQLKDGSTLTKIKFGDSIPIYDSTYPTAGIIFNINTSFEIRLVFGNNVNNPKVIYRDPLMSGFEMITSNNTASTSFDNNYAKFNHNTKELEFKVVIKSVSFVEGGAITSTNKLASTVGSYYNLLSQPTELGQTAFVIDENKAYIAVDSSNYKTWEDLPDDTTDADTQILMVEVDTQVPIPSTTGGTAYLLGLSNTLNGNQTSTFHPLGVSNGDGLMGVYDRRSGGGTVSWMWSSADGWISTKIIFDDTYIIEKMSGSVTDLTDYLNAAFKFYLGSSSATGIQPQWVEYDIGTINKGTCLYGDEYNANNNNPVLIFYDEIDGWCSIKEPEHIRSFKMGLENGVWNRSEPNPSQILIPYADAGTSPVNYNDILSSDNIKGLEITVDEDALIALAQSLRKADGKFPVFSSADGTVVRSITNAGPGICLLSWYGRFNSILDYGGDKILFLADASNAGTEYLLAVLPDNTIRYGNPGSYWIYDRSKKVITNKQNPSGNLFKLLQEGATNPTNGTECDFGDVLHVNMIYKDIGVVKPESTTLTIDNGRIEVIANTAATTDNKVASMSDISKNYIGSFDYIMPKQSKFPSPSKTGLLALDTETNYVYISKNVDPGGIQWQQQDTLQPKHGNIVTKIGWALNDSNNQYDTLNNIVWIYDQYNAWTPLNATPPTWIFNSPSMALSGHAEYTPLFNTLRTTSSGDLYDIVEDRGIRQGDPCIIYGAANKVGLGNIGIVPDEPQPSNPIPVYIYCIVTE